jgi:hypothetical protein
MIASIRVPIAALFTTPHQPDADADADAGSSTPDQQDAAQAFSLLQMGTSHVDFADVCAMVAVIGRVYARWSPPNPRQP